MKENTGPRPPGLDKDIVFDAGVLSIWYSGDRRPRAFFQAVEEGRSRGHISGVNLAEFYYKTCQKVGRQSADTWYYQAVESGLLVSSGEGIDRSAGLEKCRHPTLSIADCFALALAKREGALLLTTDGELAKVREVRAKHFTVGP